VNTQVMPELENCVAVPLHETEVAMKVPTIPPQSPEPESPIASAPASLWPPLLDPELLPELEPLLDPELEPLPEPDDELPPSLPLLALVLEQPAAKAAATSAEDATYDHFISSPPNLSEA
jgi:hypothetical protein